MIDNIFWTGNLGEAGALWYAYQSAWLPASFLEADRRESLADALFDAAKHRGVALHCNKGLAGAPAEAIAAARDTPMNPAVVDAFALAISGDFGQPAYPGVPGHEPARDRRRPPRRAGVPCCEDPGPGADAPRVENGGAKPDMTLLEIQERLIANCGERFSSSVIWRFFDRHGITF